MNKRRFLALLLAMPATLSAQSGGAKPEIDVAREIFSRAVSASLGLKEKKFTVSPVQGVEPDEFYASLKTGSLFAWSASDKKGKILVRGFAGLGETGGIAFEKYQGGIGQPGGLADLLKACHILDRKSRLPLDQIVARVAYCLNRWDIGETAYDKRFDAAWTPPKSVGDPVLKATKTGAILTYFTAIPGNTGSFSYAKVTLTIQPDHTTAVQREGVPY